MINFDSLSIESRSNLNDVRDRLSSCRTKLDQCMYCFDRGMDEKDYAEFRNAYDHICKALEIVGL